MKKIQDAKKMLEMNGYHTKNLWTIHDVLDCERNENLTDEDAQWVLDKVLCSEWITEQIFIGIRDHIELLIDKNKQL